MLYYLNWSAHFLVTGWISCFQSLRKRTKNSTETCALKNNSNRIHNIRTESTDASFAQYSLKNHWMAFLCTPKSFKCANLSIPPQKWVLNHLGEQNRCSKYVTHVGFSTSIYSQLDEEM